MFNFLLKIVNIHKHLKKSPNMGLNTYMHVIQVFSVCENNFKFLFFRGAVSTLNKV